MGTGGPSGRLFSFAVGVVAANRKAAAPLDAAALVLVPIGD